MAGGKNIKTILPSWLLATCFSSRAGLGSAERLDLSSSTGFVEGRTGQVGIMKCHFGRVQRPALGGQFTAYFFPIVLGHLYPTSQRG